MMAKTASADNKELARGQWLAAAEAAGDLVPVIFGIGQADEQAPPQCFVWSRRPSDD
jgi:hypothetical protein